MEFDVRKPKMTSDTRRNSQTLSSMLIKKLSLLLEMREQRKSSKI